MRVLLIGLLLFAGPGLAPGQTGTDSIRVKVHPERPLIERSACCQLLNFDLELTSPGPDTLTITRIDLSLLNQDGKVVSRRHVSGNGMIPSIATVPNRRLAPGRATTVYNPFYSFDLAAPIQEMRLTITLEAGTAPCRAVSSSAPRPIQARLISSSPSRDGSWYWTATTSIPTTAGST